MTDEKIQKTGFVTISGRPNAGKSTLLNALLEQKISIVSSKPQTTRNRIVGILNSDGHQIIFIDTPGITQGKDELGRRMKKGAEQAVADADIVLRVVDSAKVRLPKDGSRLEFSDADRPTLLILNKVDLIKPKRLLLPMIQTFAEIPGIEAVIPISALRSDGVDNILDEIKARLPQGPPLYPPDMITDRPERFFASELVRESVLRLTRQEVPHATAVAITSWKEVGGTFHIDASIYVERKNQKAILIGRGGEMIKTIGTAARKEISEMLDETVHLNLRVEVSTQWRHDPASLRELGYDE